MTVSGENEGVTPSARGASTAAASLSREVAGHPWYIQDAIKRLNLQAETLLGFNEFMADRQIVELRKRDAAFYQHVADTLASLYSEVKSLRDRLNHAAASEAPASGAAVNAFTTSPKAIGEAPTSAEGVTSPNPPEVS